MKAEPFLIASTTNLIIAQRLVRRLCPEGKQKYRLKAAELKRLEKQFDLTKMLKMLREEKIIPDKANWSDIDFFRPSKSADCPDGYKGRIGIYEVLEISESIKELIIKEATSGHIEEQARKEGMLALAEDGFVKAVQGITSIEEVLRVTSE